VIPTLQKVIDSRPFKLDRALGGGWEFVRVDWCGMVYRDRTGLLAIVSLDEVVPEVDSDVFTAEKWLHVSVSRTDRLPSWEDLKAVKDRFIGRDREAIQVIPRSRDFVNVHPFCLHLWAPAGDRT